MTSDRGESAPCYDATAWVILSLLALMACLANFNRVSISVAGATATLGVCYRLRAPFPVLSDLPPWVCSRAAMAADGRDAVVAVLA